MGVVSPPNTVVALVATLTHGYIMRSGQGFPFPVVNCALQDSTLPIGDADHGSNRNDVSRIAGKRDALMTFVGALNGERRADFTASQETVHSENWYLQSTPIGDFVIAQFEAPSIAAVFQGLATAEDEFAIWYRAQILDITGIDLTNLTSALPERIFEWKRGA